MAYVPRYRRLSALVLIAVTNIGFYILPIQVFNPEKVALLVSMVIAVTISFLFSTFSHIVKIERILYKYVISGVLGILVGAAVFFVLQDSTFLSMEWVNSKGKVLLIALNGVGALFLFFVKQNKSQKDEPQQQE